MPLGYSIKHGWLKLRYSQHGGQEPSTLEGHSLHRLFFAGFLLAWGRVWKC